MYSFGFFFCSSRSRLHTFFLHCIRTFARECALVVQMDISHVEYYVFHISPWLFFFVLWDVWLWKISRRDPSLSSSEYLVVNFSWNYVLKCFSGKLFNIESTFLGTELCENCNDVEREIWAMKITYTRVLSACNLQMIVTINFCFCFEYKKSGKCVRDWIVEIKGKSR